MNQELGTQEELSNSNKVTEALIDCGQAFKNSPKSKLETRAVSLHQSAIIFPDKIIDLPADLLKRIDELHIAISKTLLDELLGGRTILLQMTNFSLIYKKKIGVDITKNTGGIGSFIDAGDYFKLIGKFPRPTIHNLIMGLKSSKDFKIKISTLTDEDGLAIAIDSSGVTQKKRHQKIKHSKKQKSANKPKKNFVPGGDHEKLFPVTNPKPEGLDRIIW